MNQPKSRIPILAVGALAAGCLAGCGQSRQVSAEERGSYRAALLGSAEDWGLLGLARDGGPLSYRRAVDLETPTWAPPELGDLEGAWLTDNAIWVRFSDSRIGRYEYKTGRMVHFEGVRGAELALPLPGLGGLLVADPQGTVRMIGAVEDWRIELGGRPLRLEPVDRERAVAWVTSDSVMELLVLAPPKTDPIGRRRLPPIRDLVAPPWSQRLFYLPVASDPATLHSLMLPGLEDGPSIELAEPGQLLATTPSGHRLYVAAGRRLHVYSSLSGKELRSLELPGPVSDLRFAVNGATLLARLAGNDGVAVVRVGIDALLGVIDTEWRHGLPVALPGGGVVTGSDSVLALYDLPRLREVARSPFERARLWFPVEWRPPRPLPELASRGGTESASPGDAAASPTPGPADGDEVGYAAPGFYAVVLAARNRKGVDDIVNWLQGVDYPAAVDRHEDVMGQVWYRALVGPYPARGPAEKAAEDLNARYGYKPWILAVEGAEVRPAATDSVAGAVESGAEDTAADGEDDGATGGL